MCLLPPRIALTLLARMMTAHPIAGTSPSPALALLSLAKKDKLACSPVNPACKTKTVLFINRQKAGIIGSTKNST